MNIKKLSSLRAFILPALFALAPLTSQSQESVEIRQLALTHSGAYDFYTINDQPAGDSLYPYVTRMAQAGGHSYLLDGTFGPQFDAFNPTGAFVAEVQAATEDGFVSQWQRDSDTPLEIDNVPGATLTEKSYTSMMFSPRNFVGYWFDETSGEIALNSEGIPEGLNPQNDPSGFQLLIDEYVAAINVFTQSTSEATIYIYEFLPPAFAFPFPEDSSQDNTILQTHIDDYVHHVLGRHQTWLDTLSNGIRNHAQLSNSASIETVPVNRIIGELLRDHPELIRGRDWFDFARDGAPHFGDAAGSSDFFEAFIAPILYGALFGEAVPTEFALESGNIFEADFPMIRSYVDNALDNSASDGDSGENLSWNRWEDTSESWTLTNATNFNPASEGLPAPENNSVISLYSDLSEATISVQGTGIRLYGLVFPDAASGNIYLNGSLVATQSWENAVASANTLIWESDQLAPNTTHTIRIQSTGDWIAIDSIEVFTDQPGDLRDPIDPIDPGDPEEPEPPTIPTVERPDVSGACEFVVDIAESGITTSIQAAVNAALAGDTIRVLPGTYAESVTVSASEITIIADGDVHITGAPNGTHGFYVDGTDIEIRGFTVRGIEGFLFPNDHNATGFVLNGVRTRLINCTAHSNGFKGFLILPSAEDALIEGGSAYDNTAAGIGIAGGSDTTIRNMSFYSTGSDGGPDGTFQASAIISDNWGDYGPSPSQPLDGISPINGLLMENLRIYDHPDYGIRISAYNEATSSFPSDRISSSNVSLIDSNIYNNGSRLSSWVGGLYHLGGVLLQHIEGGNIEGNVIKDNYFWGIDAYRCNNMTYRDNWFINNDKGLASEGLTFEPVNIEINGGLNNLFTNNLVFGGFAGVFLSWIPDSGDTAQFGADSIVVENNIIGGHIDAGLNMVLNDEGLSSRTVHNNLVEYIPRTQIDYLLDDHGIDLPAPANGNILGNAPGFFDGRNGDFRFLESSPLRSNSWGPSDLRAASPIGFDTWIRNSLAPGALESELSFTANPDGDTRANLIDYALGGEANQIDTGASFAFSRATESISTITVTLRSDDPALDYHLQISDDLRGWQNIPLQFENDMWQTGSAGLTIDTAQNLGDGLWELNLSLVQSSASAFIRLSVDVLWNQSV